MRSMLKYITAEEMIDCAEAQFFDDVAEGLHDRTGKVVEAKRQLKKRFDGMDIPVRFEDQRRTAPFPEIIVRVLGPDLPDGLRQPGVDRVEFLVQGVFRGFCFAHAGV